MSKQQGNENPDPLLLKQYEIFKKDVEISVQNTKYNILKTSKDEFLESKLNLQQQLKEQQDDFEKIIAHTNNQKDFYFKEKNDLEAKLLKTKKKKKQNKQKYTGQIEKLELQLKQTTEDYEFKIKTLNAKLINQEKDIARNKELTYQVEKLELDLKNSVAQQQYELAERQKEFIFQSKRQKEEFQEQLQKAKIEMLEIKKGSIQEAEQLIQIQNNQLFAELDYQSKETLKIAHKNQKLNTEFLNNKRENEINKMIQTEQAKKNVFLIQRIRALKAEIESLKSNKKDQEFQNKFKNLNQQLEEEQMQVSDCKYQLDSQNGLIKSLKKQIKKQEDISDNLQAEINKMKSNVSKIMKVLLIFYQKNGVLNVNQSQQDDYCLNINKLKSLDNLEFLEQNEIQSIVLILLNQIRHFLTEQNMTENLQELQENINHVRVNILPQQNINMNEISTIPKDISIIENSSLDFSRNFSLPVIKKVNESSIINKQSQIDTTYQSQNNPLRLQGLKHISQQIPVAITTRILKSDLRDWQKIKGLNSQQNSNHVKTSKKVHRQNSQKVEFMIGNAK